MIETGEGIYPDEYETELALPRLNYIDIDEWSLSQLPDAPIGFESGETGTWYNFDETIYIGDGQDAHDTGFSFTSTYDAPEVEVEEVSGWEAFKAGFIRENSLASALHLGDRFSAFGIDESFDINDPSYASYLEIYPELAFSESKREFDFRLDRIRREEEIMREIEERGGAGLMGMMSGAVTDPFILGSVFLPGGVYLAGTARASRARTAFNIGAAAVAGEIPAELAKHEYQTQRTFEESMINIVAAGALGGALGGGIAHLKKAKFERTAERMADDIMSRGEFMGPRTEEEIRLEQGVLQKVSDDPYVAGQVLDDAIGAARAGTAKLEDYELVQALWLEKLPFNPHARIATSKSLLARQLIHALADSPFYHKGHARGISLSPDDLGSVEGQIKLADQIIGEATHVLHDTFYRYRQAAGVVAKAKLAVTDFANRNKTTQELNYDQFKEEVTKALRNQSRHPIAEVQEAAQHLRDKVYLPAAKKLQEADLITKPIPPKDLEIPEGLTVYDLGFDPNGLTDADLLQYVNRMYDFNKIIAQKEIFDDTGKVVGGFKKILADHLEEEQQKWMAKTPWDLLGRRARTQQGDWEAVQAEVEALERELQDAIDVGKEAKRKLAQYDIDPNKPTEVKTALGLNQTPMTVARFIREEGGLLDTGRELAARDISNRTYVGIINNKTGMSPDHARTFLWEHGYFPRHATPDDITIDDVLELVAKDIFDERVYAGHIQDQVDSIRALQQMPDYQLLKEAGLGRLSRQEELAEFYRDVAGVRSVETLRHEIDKLKPFAKISRQSYEAAQKEFESWAGFFNLSRGQLEDVADEIILNIGGTAAGKMKVQLLPDSPVFKASPLKSRTLQIPDYKIQDYLVNDAQLLTRAYIRSVTPQLALTRAFGEIDMKSALDEVRIEYGKIEAATRKQMAADGKTQREINKWALKHNKQMRRDIKDLEAVRDKLLGHYNLPQDPNSKLARFGAALKKYNLLANLGAMTISAIPDVARPLMARGMTPFIRQFKALGSTAKQMSVAELRKMGMGYEAVLNTRSQTIADITDELAGGTAPEKILDAMTARFGKVSGMAYWNDFWKLMAGSMVQDEMLRAANTLAKGGKLTKKQIRDAAKSGIGIDELEAIGRQNIELVDNKLWIANTDAWTDKALVGKFQAAIRKASDEIIVTPGAGEMPLWVSSPVASHIFQFKSFIMSAQSKVLVSGLQQADKELVMGVIAAMALGGSVTHIKNALAGRETNIESWGDFIYESFDRSGMMGVINEPLQIAAKATGGVINPKRLWGGDAEVLSRYKARNIWGTFGPTTDFIGDTLSVSRALSTGEISEGDVRAARRLLPYQNLFYISHLLNEVEKGVASKVVNK